MEEFQMKKSLLALLFVFSQHLYAADVGFAGGNQRDIISLSGSVWVTCMIPGELSRTQYYTCEEDLMAPSSYDYFLGPAGLSADTVVLNSQREDGTTQTKNLTYDSEKGRSSDPVNLWIWTLLQRPLLKEGLNRVSYTLTQNGTTVGQGTVDVSVKLKEKRTCPQGSIIERDSFACDSPYSACRDYFYLYNYCKQ